MFSCTSSGQASACYDATRMFEHHGDYQVEISSLLPINCHANANPGLYSTFIPIPTCSTSCCVDVLYYLQPKDDLGGLNGLSETYPDGYGKLVTLPIGLEGDLNDVRAVDSPPLEWCIPLSNPLTSISSHVAYCIQLSLVSNMHHLSDT